MRRGQWAGTADGSQGTRAPLGWASTLLLALAVGVGSVDAATSRSLAPTDAAAVERNGSSLPVKTLLRDEQGADLSLSDAIGGKPAILALGYFRCPNLCTLVFNGVADAVAGSGLRSGTDVRLLSVSIDPKETSELARMKKRTYLSRIGIGDESSKAWRFLTGNENAIQAIADSIGFRFTRDPSTGEYAHPAGIVVLTPSGKISRYFPGIRFDPEKLRTAVQDAGQGSWTRAIGTFFMTCLHYDPSNSRRSATVLSLFRGLGVAFIVLLAGAGYFAFGRGRRKAPA